jgi:DNA-binding IclR family transcriptional regulator
MMQREKSAQRTHGSLEKGVRLLTAFLPDNKEIGVVELAKPFSMNRSTVSRMLTVLKRLGFVL